MEQQWQRKAMTERVNSEDEQEQFIDDREASDDETVTKIRKRKTPIYVHRKGVVVFF